MSPHRDSLKISRRGWKGIVIGFLLVSCTAAGLLLYTFMVYDSESSSSLPDQVGQATTETFFGSSKSMAVPPRRSPSTSLERN